ncbi:MAG: nucleotide-binding protein, partial [Proteobacteria bacterium]|nr:nucleotide-binding protein [Pseudomonadota bacterium]
MSELDDLKDLYGRRDAIPEAEGRGWVERVSVLLHRLAPARAEEFDQLTPYLFAGLSTQLVAPTWVRIASVVGAAIAEVESSTGASAPDSVADPRSVFVVHGRNEALRKSLFEFLRAIGLVPIEWAQAIRATGKPSPYVGEILASAFGKAQAVVVLLSPDDEVRLSGSLWGATEPPHERTIQMQARPNVLFEAGMAFGTHADRTVLVQVGHVKPFSDVAGRHVLQLDDSPQRRTDLAQRLET